MARGFLFAVTAARDDVEELDASQFESSHFHHVDYVGECDDPEQAVNGLLEHLRGIGFDPEYDEDLDAYLFVSGSAQELLARQEAHFAKKLETLKSKVNSMPLHQFASDPFVAYGLVQEIDDDDGDAVWFTADPGRYPAFYTLDNWLRRLKPDTIYYLANSALLMH